MSLSWWRRLVTRKPHSSPRRTARERSPRVRWRLPLLEVLEDRTLLSASIPLNSTSWTPIGPAPVSYFDGSANSGRITGVVADPTNANIVYIAAAGGGVWKTINGGVNWTPLTDSQATLFMGSITLAPSDPNTIYAGTGEPNDSGDAFYGRGVLKSSDGGTTWTLEAGNPGVNEFDRRTIGAIQVDANDPNTVYVAVGQEGVNGLAGNTGIWKSTDGGQTWTNTTAQAGLTSNLPYSDVVMDPTNSQILYAAIGDPNGNVGNGVFKTTNGGATWTQLGGRLPSGPEVGRIALTISKTNSPQTLYAAIQDSGSANFKQFGHLFKFMKSTDGGFTWADLTARTPDFMGGQGDYDVAIAIDPSNAKIVYAGGSSNGGSPGYIQSQDGGNSWRTIPGPHTDVHAFGFDASGKLLTGNDGGIWRLTDPVAGTWTDINGNLQITQFTGIALHPTDANIAYGGSQDNGTEKFTDNLKWNQVFGGDGGFVRIDAANPNTVYNELPGAALSRSDNGGLTWTALTGIKSASGFTFFYTPYVIDPGDSSRLLLGTDEVNESLDRGATWTNLSTPFKNGWNTGNLIDWVAVAPSDFNTIYASAGGLIFVTSNHGASWTQANNPAANFGLTFSEIIVDPSDANTAYVVAGDFRSQTGSGQVWQTTNAGSSWRDLTSNLPDSPINTILLDPWSKVLYVGNDIGVYASDTYNVLGGINWVRLESGLSDAQVVDLELNTVQLQQNVRGYILGVGTHGRGMWEINTVHFSAQTDVPPAGVTAGTQFNLTVTALDPFNQPLQGFTGSYTGTVHFSSSDLKAVLPLDYTFTTQDNATHTFQVTLETAGLQTITVSDTTGGVTPFVVGVQVNPAAATTFTVAAPSTSVAGLAFDITVTALDQFGNVSTGYTGTVHFSASDTQAGVVLPLDYTFTTGGTAATDNGVHTFVFGGILDTAGLQTITATDKVTSSITGTAVINVLPAAASHFTVSIPPTATAGAGFNVTVTALDPFGNRASGYLGTVHFSTSDTALGVALPPDYTFVPGDSGQHTFSGTGNQVILDTAGTQTLTATDTNTKSIAGLTTVAVVASKANHLVILPGTPTPTAGVAFTITVQALDPFNNIATGYTGTVHFSSSDANPGITLPADYQFQAADAGAHAFVNGVVLKTSGSQTITATDTAIASIAGQAIVNVTAAAATHFVITPPASATAGASFSVTVTALDQFNNIATGYSGTVHFTATDTGAGVVLPIDYAFTTGAPTTDNGVHTFTNAVTLVTAGTDTLSVADTLSPSTLNGSAAIKVVAAKAVKLVVGTSTSAPIAGAAFTVTVSAFDTFGNLATGYSGTVHFTVTDTGTGVQIPANYTFTTAGTNPDNGTHNFLNGMVLVTAGKQTITVTDTANSSITGNTTVTVVAGAASQFSVTTTSSTEQAGTPFNITVTAVDNFGNAAAGYLGTIHFTTTDKGVGVFLPGDYHFVTADNGTHTFVNGGELVTAGAQTITATDTINGTITGTAAVTVNPAKASKFLIQAPANAIAGQAFSVTVTAEDRFGNVATSYSGTVHFSASDVQTGVLLPVDYSFTTGGQTSDNGVHTFSNGVALDTAGTQTLTVTDTGSASTTGSTTVSISAAAASHLVVGVPFTATAGVAFSVTVTAVDVFGNQSGGYNGTIHFATSDKQAGVMVPGDYTFKAGDGGQHTFINGVVLDTAGTQTLTATDIAVKTITGSSTLQVTAGVATHFVLGLPAAATAGVAFTVTVTAEDRFNNTAAGYTGTVHFSSLDPQATLPADYTFSSGGTNTDNGLHTFVNGVTLGTKGNQSITVNDTVVTSTAGTGAVVVNPAAATHFSIIGPSSVVAGSAFGFTVTALDPFGNTDTNYTGTVHFTSSDGLATLPGDYPFKPSDQGVHLFQFANGATLRKAGTQTITATDVSAPAKNGVGTFTVSPGTPNHFGVQAPSGVTAGADFSITVTVMDQFNNVATTYNGLVHFTSSDNLATLPANYLFTTGGATTDNGVHTFTALILRKPGSQTVTVSDVNVQSLSATVTVPVASRVLATGSDAGAGPFVKVLDAVTLLPKFSFNAYAAGFQGGVRVAVADVNGDGVPDIITAPGFSGGPDIRIFDGRNGTLMGEFFAYDVGFLGGVFVAVGDVNGDGKVDIITGADAGGGPHVKVFYGNGDGTFTLGQSYFAFSPSFRGGVRVAAGDITGSGTVDVIAAAGPGGGPNVIAFDGHTGAILQYLGHPELTHGFFAYDPSFLGGVYVAAGDTFGNGRDEIITGPGAGGGPVVKVFDGLTLAVQQYVSRPDLTNGFFAYDPSFSGGVRVAAIDLTGNGTDDIITAPGPGTPEQVFAYDGSTLAQLDNFFAYGPGATQGVFVGGE